MVLGTVVRAARAAMRATVWWVVEGGGPAPSDGRGGAFAKGDDDNWVILVRTGVMGGMLVDGRGVERDKAEPAACAAQFEYLYISLLVFTPGYRSYIVGMRLGPQ